MTTHSVTESPSPPSGLRIGLPTSDTFVRLAGRRTLWHCLIAAVIALVCGLLYTGVGLDAILPPVLALVVIAALTILWRVPTAMLYLTYCSVCMVELLPTGMPDAVTDRVPIFWNVNTIIQNYAHLNFKAVPFTLLECLLFLTGTISLFRSVFTDRVKLSAGPLLGPILGYIFFVIYGLIVGVGTGGDLKVALQEMRPQTYFCIVYLMVVNMVTERRHVRHFLWMTAITLAIKGFLYTLRQYITLHGAPLPDQGVGSHEEAYLFDGYFGLLSTLLLCRSWPKLRNFMLIALPFVILGDLATNRRAGTAAIAVMVPVFFCAAYQAFPERRRLMAIVALACVGVFSVYYPAFKNSSSMFALPARSIKSQFQPDERDASSNAYRDAENVDQWSTIHAAPWGYGYGKHFLHVVPIADISTVYEWWDLIPHNQIYWIWMRTGCGGFLAFWIMIASIVVYSGQVFLDTSIPLDLRMTGLFTIMVVGCLLIFGLLDLQLSNPRDVIFATCWVGITAKVRSIGRRETAAAA